MSCSNDCMICCEKFNKQLRQKVVCNNPSCGFTACKTCIRQYLIGSVEDIHCMSCRKAWDNTFVILNLNRSWFIDVYTPHRVQLLFESNKSKSQEVMHIVEESIKIKRIRDELYERINNNAEYKNIKVRHHELQTKKENSRGHERSELRAELRGVSDKMRYIEKKLNPQHIHCFKNFRGFYEMYNGSARRTNAPDKNNKSNKAAFVMPCQHEKCQGFLSEDNYKCGICSEIWCKECLEIVEDGNHELHECNKDSVETAKLIRQTTKPCPKCGLRIHKASGCDQMWCIDCKTTFSWKTGEIVTGGIIHNPHYFQYLRDHSDNGIIPRQPGDDPNAGNCDDYIIRITSFSRQIKQKIKFTHFDTLPNKSKNIIMALDVLLELIHLVRDFEAGIYTIRGEIRACDNYEPKLVDYLIKDISDEEYKRIIRLNNNKKMLLTDKMYLYDMFINVGKDILQKFLANLTECFDKNPDDGEAKLNGTYKYLLSANEELKGLIKYTNEQYQIIGVSHNCGTDNLVCQKHQKYCTFNKTQYESYQIIRKHGIRHKIKDVKCK